MKPRSPRRFAAEMAAPVMLMGGGLAIGTLIALLPRSAHAMIVYDPTNYAKNVLTAARALEQVNNQIQMLQNQAQSLVNQAKNLTRVSFPELNALTQTLSRIDSLMKQAQTIEFKVSKIDQQFSSLYPSSFNNSLKLDQQVSAARSRLDTQVSAYKQSITVQAQIVENVQADTGNLNALATRSQNAEGALQAQQVTNQLLALIAKQQFQLQQMMAAQYRAQSLGDASATQTTSVSQGTTTKFLGSGSAYTPN